MSRQTTFALLEVAKANRTSTTVGRTGVAGDVLVRGDQSANGSCRVMTGEFRFRLPPVGVSGCGELAMSVPVGPEEEFKAELRKVD